MPLPLGSRVLHGYNPTNQLVCGSKECLNFTDIFSHLNSWSVWSDLVQQLLPLESCFICCELIGHSIPASIQLVVSGWVCGGRESPLSTKYGILYASGTGLLESINNTVKGQPNLLNQFVKLSLFYLLLVHAAKTVVRNRAWHSSLYLFSSAVSTYPNNGKMVANLGSQLDLHGNRSMAIALLQHAIALEPYLITAYMNLAYVQRGTEQYLEALEVCVCVCGKELTFCV